jgi:molecular chaperone DnaK
LAVVIKEVNQMAKIIGIDLGTSNSAAAVMEGGRPTIIPSAEGTSIGGKAFPSYVAFTKDNQLFFKVGESRPTPGPVTNPRGTIPPSKRKMGTDTRSTFWERSTPRNRYPVHPAENQEAAESYLVRSGPRRSSPSRPIFFSISTTTRGRPPRTPGPSPD